MRFAYHTHGSEFTPLGGEREGTAFDLVMRETDPALVTFEMDAFWVTHAGQDPVTLLHRYPGRWSLLHVKDLTLGKIAADPPYHAELSDFVPAGRGRIDWPAIFAAAAQAGVQQAYLEDECASPLETIPLSLGYLRSLPH
jgi:sugar phosphate isomerase/epimerase